MTVPLIIRRTHMFLALFLTAWIAMCALVVLRAGLFLNNRATLPKSK